MAEHFNGLTPEEDERLAFLIQECSEVIHAATMVQRHGYQNHHPNADESETNRRYLETEMGHVRAAMRLMMREGDVRESAVGASYADKTFDLYRWMHHQTSPGTAVLSDAGPITNR